MELATSASSQRVSRSLEQNFNFNSPATQAPHWRCTLLPRAHRPLCVRPPGPRRPLSPRCRLSIFDNASSLLASVLRSCAHVSQQVCLSGSAPSYIGLLLPNLGRLISVPIGSFRLNRHHAYVARGKQPKANCQEKEITNGDLSYSNGNCQPYQPEQAKAVWLVLYILLVRGNTADLPRQRKSNLANSCS